MEEAYIELSPKEVKNTSIVFLFLSVIALSWAMLQTLAPIEDDMGIMLFTLILTTMAMGNNFMFLRLNFRLKKKTKKKGLFIVSMIATIMFVIALMLHMPLLRGI